MKANPGAPTLSGASSYYDRAAAERATHENLLANEASIRAWLGSECRRAVFDGRHDEAVGRRAPRGATDANQIDDVAASRTVLVRDQTMPEGYYILTTYPVPSGTGTTNRPSGEPHSDLEWRELSQVLAAYLCQDWPEDYDGDVWAAVQDFRDGEPEPVVVAAADHVRRILDLGLDEDGLEAAMDTARVDYHPHTDGRSFHEWLTSLEVFLRRRG